MEHTPGPWRVEGCQVGKNIVTGKPLLAYLDIMTDDNEWVICRIQAGIGETSNEQAWANARLIAAAPDLLAACEAMLDAWCGYEMLAALDINTQNLVEDAIAKARGE